MLLGHQFLAALGTRCIERPGDESEGRALIEEFVRDALLLLERPEWPAAELCLQLLSVSLCRRITRQKHKKRTRIFPHVSHAVLFPSVSHAVLFPSVSYAVPFLCVTLAMLFPIWQTQGGRRVQRGLVCARHLG